MRLAFLPRHLLLPDNISATFFPNPDLVEAARIHVDAVPYAVGRRLLLGLFGSVPVRGICNHELPTEDEVGCEAGMRMWGIVLECESVQLELG